MSSILHQNVNKTTYGGLTENNRSLYPDTSVSFDIPFIGGKLVHGLSEDEVDTVEKFFGFSFTSEKGIQFYRELNFKLNDKVSSLNIEESPQDLLLYRVAVKLGFIAETKEETHSPMVNALFYVYDSKLENKEKSSINRLKAKAASFLDKLYEEEGDYLIQVAKSIFNTFASWDKDTALNKLLEFNDLTNRKDKNANKIIEISEKDKSEIQFVVDVKEAISRNFIRKNQRNFYYNVISSTEYGKNLEEVFAFLKENEDEMGENSPSDSHYSIRKQLTN